MKQIVYIITILFTLQCVSGQINTDHEMTYERLKKSVENKWKRDNPGFISTQHSFFNQYNENKYIVGLLQISGSSIPFAWDNNLDFLRFLMTNYPDLSVSTGDEADTEFKGTKIYWKTDINGLIWFNEKSYKAAIDTWYLSTLTECPETIIFPSLSFKKAIDIPNALTNNIQGLMIVPYIENLSIKALETSLKQKNGEVINGFSFDINKDGVFDIFTYQEKVDDTTFYTRLYINVDGDWKCKWINLDEACL